MLNNGLRCHFPWRILSPYVENNNGIFSNISYASLILGFYKIQKAPGTEELARCLSGKHKDLSLVTQSPIKGPVVVPHACHMSTLKVEKGGSLELLDRQPARQTA